MFAFSLVFWLCKTIEGKEATAHAKEVGESTVTNLTGERVLSIVTSRRWKERLGDVVQVPYSISGRFSQSERDTIVNAVNALSERSNVVRFVVRQRQSSYIDVVNYGHGCYSTFTGQQNKKQEVNLAAGCVTFGIVQHEFLHALGLLHEQSRPDRDNFVVIDFSNIPAKNRHNFEIASTSATLGGSYDYGKLYFDSFLVGPSTLTD